MAGFFAGAGTVGTGPLAAVTETEIESASVAGLALLDWEDGGFHGLAFPEFEHQATEETEGS